MSSETEIYASAYAPLSAAEQKLLRGVETGATVDCESGDDRSDPTNYENWNPERRIRADIIWSICRNEETLRFLRIEGMTITGAVIAGSLNLSLLDLPFPVQFIRCALPGGVAFSLSNLAVVSCEGSYVKSFYGVHMNARENVVLNGVHCPGKIALTGAKIGGDLDLSGTRILASRGDALVADHAEIGGSVRLCNGFTATGMVRFVAAKITGDLDCGGAQLSSPRKVALRAERAEIGGAVLLNKALDAPGLVDLVGGRTGSDRFVVQALRMAQEALGAKADDSDMDEHLKRFTSNGEVDLDGITIGGNLDCNGGHFINSGGRSLSVANGKIAGSVMCSVGLNSAFQAVGEVHLHGVKIDYDLLCIGSQVFESTDRLIAPTQEQTAGEVAGPEFMQRSLNVENAEIKGSIIIGPAFLEGEVRLAGARIGNDLLCNGTFINPGKDAVDATAVRVGGVVAFGRRFSSGFMTNITLSMVAGSLRFLRCSIEGDLRMDVSFGRRSEGILAQSARISGRVLLGIKQDSNQVIVNLRDARLGSLILDVLVA